MDNNVLFVDDEVHILKAIKRGLYKESFNKFFASSGQEALEILEAEDIHVIVSDMKMPRMNGLELLTIVKEKYPKIIKIILSGYTQLQQIIVTINRIDIYKFITKPWDMEVEFREVILSAIDLYNTRDENEKLKKSIEKKNELYQKMLQTNNERLMLVKGNFAFIQSLNGLLVNYYYFLGMKMNKDLITDQFYYDEIEFISMLMDTTLKHMPSEYRELNSHMIKGKIYAILNKFLKDELSFEFKDLTANKTYLGEYYLISMTLENVLKYYYDFEKVSNCALVISEKQEEDSNAELILLFKLTGTEILANKIRRNSLELFFECLLKSINGSLSFEVKQGEYLFIMKIPTYSRDEV